MGQGRSVARVAVLEKTQQEKPSGASGPASDRSPHRTSHSPPGKLSPHYAAALLKLAVKLRRPEPQALDELIASVLQGLPVDGTAFRDYVQRNFSLLRRG